MAKPAQQPTAPADEEQSFPRGGASSITPLKRRQIRAEAQADAERDFFASANADTNKRRKKGRRAGGAQEEEVSFLTRQLTQGKAPAFVELLKFKTCNVGAKVWGAITDITNHSLTVSLLDGLKGHVAAEEASDYLANLKGKNTQLPPLSELFSVGQLVKGVVTGTDIQPRAGAASSKAGKKMIYLSLAVSKVNAALTAASIPSGVPVTACVTSVEDHGYTVVLGNDVKGYLSKRTLSKGGQQGGQQGVGGGLKPGMLVECMAQGSKSKAGKTIKVTADPSAIAEAVTDDYEGLNIGALMPGALVNAQVQSMLPGGLILSFLTFFTGTVDQYHLTQVCPGTDHKEHYSKDQKVKARIVYVDPASKQIKLSLQPELVDLTLRQLPPIGQVFQDLVVRRIDEGLGLLLEVPSEPALTPGFVHVSNAGEAKIDKLQQAYRVGQKVKGRVIGARPLDGLSVLSLKPTVVEQQVASLAEVKPGSLMTGTISSIADYGLLVALAPGIRALVPAVHMANTVGRRSSSKYKEGQEVTGRILEVDVAKKRISMTLKKLLCSDKLPLITAFQDAEPGMRSHGYITGIKPYGIFVSFFGGMKGLAHVAELPLAPEQAPKDAYQIGQVVKCRVLSTDFSHQRLKLSLMGKKSSDEGAEGGSRGVEGGSGADSLGGLQPGDVVQGTVKEIETSEEDGEQKPKLFVMVLEGGAHGQLEAGHLADHPSAVTALQGALQVGSPLGSLLVLDRVEASGFVKLTRKASLVSAASALPRTISDIREAMLVPGYITNVTNDACYVRFLGQLTGRAGLAQLADVFVSDPSRHYQVGQSVRAQVVQVDNEKERFTVSLKQSLVGASDAAYLQSLLKDLEVAEALRLANDPDVASRVHWDIDFAIGRVTDASVHELKDYGVVLDFAAHADVLGLAATHQVVGTPKGSGAALKTRILDVSKDTGIVDVTLKPILVESATAAAAKRQTGGSQHDAQTDKQRKKSKKRKAPEALDAARASDELPQVSKEPVTAVVELIKDDYVVLSLPKHKQALGFAAVTDYNLQNQEARAGFTLGQQLQARVSALPSKDTGGRLVMHVPLLTDAQAAKKGSSKGQAPKAGQLVKGRITAIHSVHMDVTLQSGAKGKVCLCDVQDAEQAAGTDSKPFEGFSAGRNVEAVCLGLAEGFEGRKLGIVDLTLKPAALAAAADDSSSSAVSKLRLRASKLKPGQTVWGYVQEVQDQHLNVQLSSAIRSRVSIFDSAEDPEDLSQFAERFSQGQPIQCRVSQVDRPHNQADLSLRDLNSGSKLSSATAATAPEGTLLLGQVVIASASMVRIHIGRRVYGNVAVTDIHDGWVDNPTEAIKQGMFVKCCVVGRAGQQGRAVEQDALQLSLKKSDGAVWAGQGSAVQTPAAAPAAAFADVKQLTEGLQVNGYVKSTSKAGVFVTIGRGIDARVKLGQLSTSFVDNPAAAFPPGKLVKGKILSVSGDRVEMTLKESQGGSWAGMGDLKKGDVVKGRIKRLEAFGAFIELHNSALTGLAHISQISDDYVKNLQDVFQIGQGVRAMVLDVDTKQQRLSLGLKASFFSGAQEDVEASDEGGSDIEEEMAEMQSGSEEDEAPLAQVLGLDAAEDAEASSGEQDEADESSDAASSADDQDLDIDDLGDPQTSASDSDSSKQGSEDEEDEEQQAVHAQPAKKQKTGKEQASRAGQLAQQNGLNSVGWDASDEDEAHDVVPAAAEDETAVLQKASKAQKRREKEEHERQVRQRELARVSEAGSQPESAEGFERAVLGAPNSSLIWIQYMAFFISLGEVEKARGIAERGLATINYREEAEKFNIWQAWLNLENMYGSPTAEEAVTRLFQKALPYCNAKKLYLALLDILERTNKDELAEQTLKAMCRKFSSSAKMWLRNISWLLSQGRAEAARKALDRSFTALPQRKHIKVISHTAIQEFKIGSAERGRSMFESCLRNYPARLDVWSQYLDQEVKLGDKQRIEALFERAVHMQLPPKKMKFLFKRYLQYEEEHGDAAAVARVKRQALDFVQQHIAT